MSQIRYEIYQNLPKGSKPVIEDIALKMEKYGLIPFLGTEHIMGFPLNPSNLISFSARYGTSDEIWARVISGRQFQRNITLMRNLCLVVKELYEDGAVPVVGEYRIGNPLKGEGFSLSCDMDYRRFRVRMTAIPTAMTFYDLEGGGMITGYEQVEETIQEMRRLAQPLQIADLSFNSEDS